MVKSNLHIFTLYSVHVKGNEKSLDHVFHVHFFSLLPSHRKTHLSQCMVLLKAHNKIFKHIEGAYTVDIL